MNLNQAGRLKPERKQENRFDTCKGLQIFLYCELVKTGSQNKNIACGYMNLRGGKNGI